MNTADRLTLSALPPPVEWDAAPPDTTSALPWLTPEDRRRLGVGESPCFHVSMPLALWNWLRRPTAQDDPRGLSQRMEWLAEEALDLCKQHARLPLPVALFGRSVPWTHPMRLCVSPETALHLRLWAKRIEVQVEHLIVAIVRHAHKRRDGGPIHPPFALEFTE